MLLASAAQIREADRAMIEDLGYPGLLLMESAGRLAAERILSRFSHHRIYILAGPGNNGGDGLVIARYLAAAGRAVQILLSHPAQNYKGDAASAWAALQGSGITVAAPEMAIGVLQQCESDALLVDALLGTGAGGPLRGKVADLITTARQTGLPMVAIDLPSGLDADTGACENETLQAVLTLTFQTYKPCHVVYPAAARCGEVQVLDIGIWPHVLNGLHIRRQVTDIAQLKAWHRPRQAESHKGSHGHALLAGGSRAYAGAAALAAHAALRVGAGLCSAWVPEAARVAVHALGPEIMVRTGDGDEFEGAALDQLNATLSGKQAIAIGPGLGQGEGQLAFLRGFLAACTSPLVLDADALNLLAAHPDLWPLVPPGSILTPHPGEMRRLDPACDPVHRRLEAAEAFAQRHGAILVLKGAGTVIALPDGRTWVNPTGNPGMGKGGSGDVLTGVILGLLAQGYTPEVAAVLGVFLHGHAGDLAVTTLGQEGLLASDLLAALPSAFLSILSSTTP
jgi:ADP-dependent NAD(P)H-hydrate dehydratase / NAD(P)H-hydrate epimerase